MILNLAYYGLVACALVYTLFDRSLHQALMDTVGGALAEGPLASVLDAYTSERVLLAIGLCSGSTWRWAVSSASRCHPWSFPSAGY